MNQPRKTAQQLLAAARAQVAEVTAAELIASHRKDDVVVVDLRDSAERQTEGVIPNAIHVPRGSLEFSLDPDSPAHKRVFSSGKQFVFYCAGGSRSALAAQTAMEMGLQRVSHLAGGFAAWKQAGGPVEKA